MDFCLVQVQARRDTWRDPQHSIYSLRLNNSLCYEMWRHPQSIEWIMGLECGAWIWPEVVSYVSIKLTAPRQSQMVLIPDRMDHPFRRSCFSFSLNLVQEWDPPRTKSWAGRDERVKL